MRPKPSVTFRACATPPVSNGFCSRIPITTIAPARPIACAPYAAHVFKRPGALRTMNKLNANEAANQGRTDFPHVPEHMPIDVLIDEGDTVASGGMALSVMAAPGHTKDCLAFWDPKSRLLVSCETSCVYGGPLPQGFVGFDGNPAPDDVSCLADTAFLVGWQMSLDYIERAIALEPEYVLVPHYGIMAGEEGRGFLRSARYFTQYAADLIVHAHDEGLSNEEVQARYKDFFYTDYVKSIQPEMAFDLNASYTVPLVIRERCGACLQEPLLFGASGNFGAAFFVRGRNREMCGRFRTSVAESARYAVVESAGFGSNNEICGCFRVLTIRSRLPSTAYLAISAI